MEERLLKEIKKIVGGENLFTSREKRVCYSYDATNLLYLPDAVVFPGCTEEVAALLRLANRYRFPVVPRGAGTGMTGGSVPVKGGVVIAFARMNRIIEIDEDNLIAVVQPGVINYDLRKEAEKRGLYYPPDPASLKYSTIGGNVAECAGGPHAVKYGVTRDYVLALEVVLPTGEVIRTGARTVKSVVGYDLTRLFVGSEGTLGVITEIVLKLIPLPEAKRTLLAVFPDIRDAARTVSDIIRRRIVPTTLEFMDNNAIRCVEDYLHLGLPVEAGAILLIEVDGAEDILDSQVHKISNVCRENGASGVEIARDEEEAEKLWLARRSISASIAKLAPTKVNEDIAVPRSKVPDIINGIAEIAEKFDLPIVNFGHAGDGNIHVNIMSDRRDVERMKRAEEAVRDLFRLVLSLGGSISGEHGIGISKAPYMAWETGENVVNLMKSMKRLFDPNGILNPGKLFYNEDEKEKIEKSSRG